MNILLYDAAWALLQILRKYFVLTLEIKPKKNFLGTINIAFLVSSAKRL